ncbi:DinB family protein [Streptomyces sp. PLAI1-29]|uniref:DinB family protein n=1 Tax=Streptomyces zingiberis TaxID=2053010 RepID=A0ABX1BZS3_9ACTN|nr:DinB family protein [Streptomyces zingiberis]NJQ01032.1 DinB family protein [Streptomyces zingiberis]
MTSTAHATTPDGPRPALDPERADLLAELAIARSALTHTLRGLSDEQAAARPAVGELCLGGLVKHVAATEESWLRFVLEGSPAFRYDLPEGVTWDEIMNGTARELPRWMTDRVAEFRMAPDETVAGVIRRYEEVAARTGRIVATVPGLSATHPLPAAPWHEPGAKWSVRRVLLHVIAETAQHAGHADILRESIDGRTST